MVKQAMEHPRTWEPDSADAKKSEEELIVDFLQRCAWQRAATRDYNCKGLQNYASDSVLVRLGALFQFSRFFEVFLLFLLIWCSDCFGGVLWYFGGFPGFYRFLLFSTFFCGLVRFGAVLSDFCDFSLFSSFFCGLVRFGALFSDFYVFLFFFAFFGGLGCLNDSKR